MNLDDAQKNAVARWVAEGLNLANIQKRLESELGIRLTYMEVRFLVDDLKLTPKDPERTRAVDLGTPASTATPVPGQEQSSDMTSDSSEGSGLPGKVSVAVDQIARPGTVVSGAVTFSDGKSAEWYLDQMGRLGLVPKEKGYKPPAADIPTFQVQLQNELAKMGF